MPQDLPIVVADDVLPQVPASLDTLFTPFAEQPKVGRQSRYLGWGPRLAAGCPLLRRQVHFRYVADHSAARRGSYLTNWIPASAPILICPPRRRCVLIVDQVSEGVLARLHGTRVPTAATSARLSLFRAMDGSWPPAHRLPGPGVGPGSPDSQAVGSSAAQGLAG